MQPIGRISADGMENEGEGGSEGEGVNKGMRDHVTSWEVRRSSFQLSLIHYFVLARNAKPNRLC